MIVLCTYYDIYITYMYLYTHITYHHMHVYRPFLKWMNPRDLSTFHHRPKKYFDPETSTKPRKAQILKSFHHNLARVWLTHSQTPAKHMRTKIFKHLSSAWMMIEMCFYMDVSENSGTPKSSISIGFSIINHPFWGTPNFWKQSYKFLLINGWLIASTNMRR